MEKFIRVLKELNREHKSIEEELKASKKRTSGIVNAKLKDAYPDINVKTTKEFIFAIWENILKHASRKISRTWVALFIELDKLLKILYPNKKSLRGLLSEFRKPLKDSDKWDKNIYSESIIKMGMSLDESKEISREYKAVVEARNVNRGDKPPIYVEDIFTILDKLIKSENAYELTLAVEIATGSRSIEVFKISEYKEIPNHPEQILVVGIAKDKSANNLLNVALTRNLVYLKSNQIITAVAKIRSLVNVQGTNKQISQRTNKHLNTKFKELILPLVERNASQDQKQTEEYKNYIKSFTSHKTRYLYGNASYLIYAAQRSIPLETYIQGQLGHLSGESTKSYLGVNVKFRHKLIKDVNPEVKEYIDVVDKKVNNLSKEVNECCGNSSNLPNLRNFKNSFSRRETFEEKVSKVLGAIKLLKSKKNIRFPTQSELAKILGFGSNVMSAGYRKAREENLINHFNIR